MKLYYSPGACSLASHIALREAGLPFALERVDLASKKTEQNADFTTVNPKGYVPALELNDGAVLTEGVSIMQYVADQKPDSGLAPANGTLERYRLQEWLNFIATEVHKGLAPFWKPTTPEEYKTAAKQQLAKRFQALDQHLAKHDWLMDDFMVADGYAFTVLSWTGHLNIPLDPYPHLRAYLARVAARPKVQEALAAEGLTKG